MIKASSGMLDSLRIASPCTADWNQMVGDDRTRFCSQCRRNVHDLSSMTSDEAVDLLRAAGQGRLCVRFYRRADGTVLTQDCPKGLRRRVRQAWLRTAALLTALWSSVACTRSTGGGSAAMTPGNVEAVPLQGEPEPRSPTPHRGEVEMGDRVAPPPVLPAPVAMGKMQVLPPNDPPK